MFCLCVTMRAALYYQYLATVACELLIISISYITRVKTNVILQLIVSILENFTDMLCFSNSEPRL